MAIGADGARGWMLREGIVAQDAGGFTAGSTELSN